MCIAAAGIHMLPIAQTAQSDQPIFVDDEEPMTYSLFDSSTNVNALDGNINFALPSIITFLKVEEVIRLTHVSKVARREARADVVWKHLCTRLPPADGDNPDPRPLYPRRMNGGRRDCSSFLVHAEDAEVFRAGFHPSELVMEDRIRWSCDDNTRIIPEGDLADRFRYASFTSEDQTGEIFIRRPLPLTCPACKVSCDSAEDFQQHCMLFMHVEKNLSLAEEIMKEGPAVRGLPDWAIDPRHKWAAEISDARWGNGTNDYSDGGCFYRLRCPSWAGGGQRWEPAPLSHPMPSYLDAYREVYLYQKRVLKVLTAEVTTREHKMMKRLTRDFKNYLRENDILISKRCTVENVTEAVRQIVLCDFRRGGMGLTWGLRSTLCRDFINGDYSAFTQQNVSELLETILDVF